MKTLFAVCSGEYEDFEVICLAETELMAKKIIKELNEDDAQIYSFTQIEDIQEVRKVKHYTYRVDHKGHIHDRSLWVGYPFDFLKTWGIQSWIWDDNNKKKHLVCGWSTRGWDQALKAARDNLTKIKTKKASMRRTKKAKV